MSSSSNDGALTPRSQVSQLAASCFEELLECIVVDVASECHRIARLGIDRSVDDEEEELRLSAARGCGDPGSSRAGGGEGNGGGGKGVVDVFGQTHPAIAAEVFECMNCGRPIVAGRFAPHLEKCMGKGRKARTKTTRSCTAGRSRHNHRSPGSVYAPYSNTANIHKVPNGVTGGAGEEYTDYALEES